MKKFRSALVLSLFLCRSLVAMDFADLKGITSIIDPAQQHLSPVYPMALLESGWLKRFRFCGPYGLKADLEPYAQLKGTETDNPLSHTALLLQYLFPSPDGATLVSNQREFFSLKRLSAAQLGHLFWEADQAETHKSVDGFLRGLVTKPQRKEAGKFARVLYQAFIEDRNGENFYGSMARHFYLAYALQQFNTKTELWDFLAGAKLLSPEAVGNPYLKEEFMHSRFNRDEYLQFKTAMEKSAIPAAELQRQSRFVEPYCSYQQDRLDRGTLSIWVNDQKITRYPTVDTMMASPQKYEKYAPTSRQIQELNNSPELMLLLGAAAERYENIRLDVPYGTSSFYSKNGIHSFSDCAESALFTLCNILLYDAERNCLALEKLPITTRPEFKTFFESTIGKQYNLEHFRQIWAQLLCNLPDARIIYGHYLPDGSHYELRSINTNLLQVLECIFGLNNVSVESSVAQRWHQLLSAFNSDEHQFTLADENYSENDGDMVIYVNGNHLATLQTTGSHTTLKYPSPTIPWLHRAAEKMFARMINEGQRLENLLLLSLFSNQELFNQIISADVEEESQSQLDQYARIFALASPIDTTLARSRIIEALVKTGRHSLLSPSFTGLGMRFRFDDLESLGTAAVLFKQVGAESIAKYPFFHLLYQRLQHEIERRPLVGLWGYFLWGDQSLYDQFDYNYALDCLDLAKQNDKFIFSDTLILAAGSEADGSDLQDWEEGEDLIYGLNSEIAETNEDPILEKLLYGLAKRLENGELSHAEILAEFLEETVQELMGEGHYEAALKTIKIFPSLLNNRLSSYFKPLDYGLQYGDVSENDIAFILDLVFNDLKQQDASKDDAYLCGLSNIYYTIFNRVPYIEARKFIVERFIESPHVLQKDFQKSGKVTSLLEKSVMWGSPPDTAFNLLFLALKDTYPEIFLNSATIWAFQRTKISRMTTYSAGNPLPPIYTIDSAIGQQIYDFMVANADADAFLPLKENMQDLYREAFERGLAQRSQ